MTSISNQTFVIASYVVTAVVMVGYPLALWWRVQKEESK